MKLKHLVAELEGVRTWEKPKVALEQYPTSPEIAAHMLISAKEHGDVEDAAVADLGCGGGILGIGAAILGASHVLAVDIDPDALSVAAENVAEFEVPVDLVDGPPGNRDDAPADRWNRVASLPYFRTRVPAALDYIAAQVPAWLLPTLEVVLGDVEGYFGDELGASGGTKADGESASEGVRKWSK